MKLDEGGIIKCGGKTLLPLLLFVLGSAFSLPVRTAEAETLNVSATVISKNVCLILAGATTLNFGAIDPAGTADITRTATMRFMCFGSSPMATFAFSSNDGMYETGPGANRMRNNVVTTEFLPYNISLSPQSGTVPRWSLQTLTITGTVTSPNYRSAYVGNYRDTVVISINP